MTGSQGKANSATAGRKADRRLPKPGATRLRPYALGGLAGLCCLSLTAAPVALAQGQQAQPAGPRLTFDVNVGVTATDNPDFEVNPPDGAVWATSGLSFGFLDDTAISNFSLTGNLNIRSGISGNTNSDTQISDRALRLSYARQGANAQFSFSARITESRLEFLRPLTDFIDDNGVFVPPDDLDQLTGTGWRQRLGFDTSLTLGSNAPFGATFGVGLNDIHYRDTTSTTLDDSRRTYADLDLRFDLSQVTRANVGIRLDHYEDSDQNDDDWTLRLGLSFDRPDGQLRFGVQATDLAGGGTRTQFQVGRQFQRAWGSLDLNLGAVRDTGGKTRASGAMTLVYNLPNGALRAALARSIASGTDNAATLRTTASLGYNTALTPRSGLSVNLAFVELDELATDLTTRDASFGISYSYALTQDWNLNLGYDRRRRDEDLVGVSDENTISLSVSRTFTTGF